MSRSRRAVSSIRKEERGLEKFPTGETLDIKDKKSNRELHGWFLYNTNKSFRYSTVNITLIQQLEKLEEREKKRITFEEDMDRRYKNFEEVTKRDTEKKEEIKVKDIYKKYWSI